MAELPRDAIYHYESDGKNVMVTKTELVRCKECVYWERIEASKYGFCNRAMDIRPHETIYCAFGERKDGAD